MYEASRPVPVAAVLVDHLRLTTASMYEVRDVDLRVTLNGDALSPTAVPYSYYVPPRILDISPASGPGQQSLFLSWRTLRLLTSCASIHVCSPRRFQLDSARLARCLWLRSPLPIWQGHLRSGLHCAQGG